MGLVVTRAHGNREKRLPLSHRDTGGGNCKRKGTEARYKITLRRGDARGTRETIEAVFGTEKRRLGLSGNLKRPRETRPIGSRYVQGLLFVVNGGAGHFLSAGVGAADGYGAGTCRRPKQ